MSKARDLADLIAAGILADGAISVSEISDLTATASDLNNVAGINSSVQTQLDGKQAVVAGVSSTEIGYLDGVTSALQTQLDNISVTSGSLTKSFTSGETANITLGAAISPAPVVSVTKEIAQAGIVSKGAWDVNATASNYELHNTAYAATLTAGTVLDLTSSTFDSNQRSTGGSFGPRFSSDGLKLFVNDQGANNIRQYNLSTAWLLPSSATHTTFSTASQVSDENGFCFSDNGLHFYLCDSVYGSSINNLHQYSITSGYPYDLVGYGSFTRTINMTALGEATPQVRPISSVLVEDSGTKMYIFSSSGSSALIRQYTLSTAYDPSSATYDNKSFDIYADYGSGGYLGNSSLSSDGKQLLVANGADDIVMHYTLGTAWDISTASRIGIYNPSEDANVSGVHLKPDNSKFFMLGGSNQTFYRYTLGSSNAPLTLGSGSFASTDVGKRIVGNGGDVILKSTAGAYSTTGGSAFTDGSTIASGSWSMRGLKSAGASSGLTMTGLSSIYSVSSPSFVSSLTPPSGSDHRDVRVSPDGTVLFTVEGTSIQRMTLSTAYDITTGSYAGSYNANGVSSAFQGFAFNPNGQQLYLIDSGGEQIHRVYFPTGFVLSNETPQASIGVYLGNSLGIDISDNGLHIYVSSTNGLVTQKVLSNAYNSGGGFSASHQLDVGAANLTSSYTGDRLEGLSISPDGTKLLVAIYPSTIAEYTLSTPYYVSSATLTASYSTAAKSAYNTGVDWLNSGSNFVISSRQDASGSSEDKVHMFTSSAFTMPTSQYHIATTNAGGQIATNFWTDLNTMVADQAAGGGTVNYAVSTDDKTTWSVIKEGSGVRPIVRNNSGTWQYNNELTSTSAFDLTAGSFTNTAYQNNAQDTQQYAIAVKPDGTKIYTIGVNTDDIFEYSLSTAWDISTISYTQNFDLLGRVTVGRGLVFKPDGTVFYVTENSASQKRVIQFSMTTAWDISTASYGGLIELNPYISDIRWVEFKSDGTEMYVSDYSLGRIYQFSLSTAWDVRTISYTGMYTVLGNSALACFKLNNDGTKLYAYNYSGGDVYQYSLSTAWDITTASSDSIGKSLDMGSYSKPSTFALDVTSGNMVAMRSEHILPWTGFVSTTTTYITTPVWANATTNDEFYALQQALGAQAFNRMDKTQLDAVTDPNHYTLGNTLDLMIALYLPSSGTSPTADGVTINYDAQALNQGAVLGTDYDYDFPNSTTVRVTSNAAQNLKVRVV